ncbi:WD40 repeat-like protein [Gonapodya prolifera JEL478]|uniref:WD40 repeat-like protein n=1 Tax=Gonapodya prolifera (strain JEL478) TaxID=1344416 RepID=A0A139APA0_GONPJ|nr:WD40 repeat-like protein [Gonapodya prolifera JEL478]|eukprot:KXS18570.1 WD40 repeat-like protein [Gonapodya prolifera JEL478]
MTVDCLRDDVEFVKQAPVKHPVRSSIQHWQLRDLVACPSNSREFVYVNQNNVMTYNTQTKQSNPAFKDLSFSPSSITSGCGYLAAGGQRSQLIVRQLNNNWFAQTAVGGSINNALSISRHLGDVRLLVCNNDETIKVFSLPTLEKIGNITLPTAVNYAAVSPDGRKLVAVGDSNQAFLYEMANNTYNKVAMLTTSNDAGFSCAWNHASDKFAVASQDGFVSVWDIRSSEKLCQVGSKQHPQVKGACRSVKFSPTGSIDLLVYSEHVSYFSLLDARTFNERQTVRVVPPGVDAHITGLTFAPDSRTVFVGLESAVLEYNVDTLSRRSFGAGSFL